MDTLDEMAAGIAGGGVQRRADGTLDLGWAARDLLETLLNAVMDEQASELCGQENTSRNGYRERSLDTCVGRITLKIPKLREGTYFPDDVVTRWSRTDTALAATICEMWVNGVSTRKVDAVAEEMGVTKMSRSRVSRLCESLDEQVDELRHRDLSWTKWPYLWLDATYVPCREAGAARSTALVTAVAADTDATRRVIGISCVDTESYVSWRDFLLSLRSRGLSGVRLVVSDAHEGLTRAVREVMVGASWQRCIAHLERNVADRCRRKDDGAAAVCALKAAFAESDPALVRSGYEHATELLRACDERGAELLEKAAPAALCYLDFPSEHRMWIRTNNVQERMNREVKRRTKVVQVFPSVESLIRLVGAVCCEQNDAWEGAKFIDPRSMSPTGELAAEPQAAPEEVARVLRLVEEAFDRKRRVA